MIKHIVRAEWKEERLLWIGYYKNRDDIGIHDSKCLIPLLPKDVILEIIKFFKTDLSLNTISRTNYGKKKKAKKSQLSNKYDIEFDNDAILYSSDIDNNKCDTVYQTTDNDQDDQANQDNQGVIIIVDDEKTNDGRTQSLTARNSVRQATNKNSYDTNPNSSKFQCCCHCWKC